MAKNICITHRDRSFYIHYENKGAPTSMILDHIHNDYEIYFQLEGQRKFIIGNEEYHVHDNSLVFINRNVLHKTCAANDSPHKRFVLNFQKSFISAETYYLIQLLFENGPTILNVPIQQRQLFVELLKGIQFEYSNNDQQDSTLYIQSLLIQFLIASKRLYEKQRKHVTIGKESTESDLVSSIIKYIHDQFNKSMSLSWLSQKFYVSEHYLCHLFRNVTGCTIVQYVNVVRVNEAKRLLLETNLKIHDIAIKIGFSNHVHFCRVFKKEIGKSPTQFRVDSLQEKKKYKNI
ncbi:AraC family transcriptional regulator [Fredinandcohnia onubensis]|uniref:AraC family transcriptional regulator n=1 Tax=Fredinandcohnia onubensis TaxID=1571209 RepID=UPI000C0BE609|nr:AraC family transcriptional regulator [Fredinandcohnia onubensis]